MKIDFTHADTQIPEEFSRLARQHLEELYSGKLPYTGWVDLAAKQTEEFLERVESAAEDIAKKCSLFIMIGVGGSYLGSRAVIDALGGDQPDRPKVVFSGYNTNGAYMRKILDAMKEQSTCICVISKSGSTLEPLLSYSFLKEQMFAKYGKEEASKRIYVITGKQDSPLHRDIEEYGFPSFYIPADIGGRYSVLSIVGLLPIAVAGFDIRKLLQGAGSLSLEHITDYACTRVLLQRRGKMVEIFSHFSTNLVSFGEWIAQLFGETEGKDGKGAYPDCLFFPKDLHSIGQFIQQGSRILYETMIQYRNAQYDLPIPESAGLPYAGKMLETVNRCSEEGVVKAHHDGGVPVIVLQVDQIDEFNLGRLIYFFEISAAVSAMLLDVEPFNQPGVEAYKINTKKLLQSV